jgi:hypothetical protein
MFELLECINSRSKFCMLKTARTQGRLVEAEEAGKDPS